MILLPLRTAQRVEIDRVRRQQKQTSPRNRDSSRPNDAMFQTRRKGVRGVDRRIQLGHHHTLVNKKEMAVRLRERP